jgi:hypothetical protein
MARSDDILPGLGKKGLSPRLRPGTALSQLRLRDIEAYVLSRVDGQTTLWEICLLVPLKREDTLRILRNLRALGVIEVPGSTEPMPAVEADPSPARQVQPAPPAPQPPQQPISPPRPSQPSSPPGPPAAPTRSARSSTSIPRDLAAPPPPAEPLTVDQHLLSFILSVPDDKDLVPPPPGNDDPPAEAATVSEVEVIKRSANSARILDDTRPSRHSQPRSSRLSSDSIPRLFPAQGAPAAPRPAPPPPSPDSPIGQPAAESQTSGNPPQGRLLPQPDDSGPCELTPEQRRRVDEVFARLESGDPFVLLELPQGAAQVDRRAVQRAYFRLSKEFHPDRFFKKRLGPYRQRIAAVFQALTEARDALT